MSAQWFTLSFQPNFTSAFTGDKPRGRVTLYNLQKAGADHIEQVQRDLGSHSFERTAQPHHYVQIEIDLLRGAK